ncbi:MAG: polymer-forming cytoskeletal protein [Bacteroidetes bacterium]|jgi:cytoskeletal protein CcmA (bactofilin family)|nr:polymer-forming cytoskeletal protein [Bacteroidota bacterium]MBT3747534.1 polymer-forming cytoskeletal protein [Bacteroidota bacterium]MBT4398179.1 polymer-forming cytoskeletal protein [Bacteroidota bacterium]MBT4409462.1 polymer-forming cytoskeletal protein [Bacteroidota bacterium]MBT5428164.1 polymer-forming cytoskeletal protein [Bacteroidota bacterium]
MAKEMESANNINLISNGTVVTGDIESGSGIRVDGHLKGKMTIKGKVVIGTPGQVTGDVICQLLEVSGKVSGNIQASELVSLKSSANIQGEIITKKLAIEPGAVFTGSCKMDSQTDGKVQQNIRK